MARRVRIAAGLSLVVLAGATRAGEPARPDPAPSAELLLFLAEFRDAAGHEVDPLAVAEQAEQADPATKAPAKPAPAAPKPKPAPRDEHDDKPH